MTKENKTLQTPALKNSLVSELKWTTQKMCLNEFDGFLISMQCKTILKTVSNSCMTNVRNNFQKWYPGSSERNGLEISPPKVTVTGASREVYFCDLFRAKRSSTLD